MRTRCSVWLYNEETSILVDTANEFRIQAVEAGMHDVDAVLYTHCHADHVFGFDDLRVFSRYHQKKVPIYGNRPTIEEICEVFGYAFRETQRGGGKPQVYPHIIGESFSIEQVPVIPIPVYHGVLPIYGYRFGNLAYVTDTNQIPPASMEQLYGLETLILGVVRYEPHSTHMHIDMALEIIEELQPRRTYFTHISHLLDHDDTNRRLPSGVALAYDGLEISFSPAPSPADDHAHGGKKNA